MDRSLPSRAKGNDRNRDSCRVNGIREENAIPLRASTRERADYDHNIRGDSRLHRSVIGKVTFWESSLSVKRYYLPSLIFLILFHG